MTYAIPQDWENPNNGQWERLRWPARKLANGWPVKPGGNGVSQALLDSVGAVEIVDPGASPGPDQVVDSRALVDVGGVPTVEYSYRNKTQEELDAESVQLATEVERDQAKAAVTNLRAYIQDNNPTNASTVAVVKLLCRVAIRLIKDQYGG